VLVSGRAPRRAGLIEVLWIVASGRSHSLDIRQQFVHQWIWGVTESNRRPAD
jgi:hypothetical protein